MIFFERKEPKQIKIIGVEVTFEVCLKEKDLKKEMEFVVAVVSAITYTTRHE